MHRGRKRQADAPGAVPHLAVPEESVPGPPPSQPPPLTVTTAALQAPAPPCFVPKPASVAPMPVAAFVGKIGGGGRAAPASAAATFALVESSGERECGRWPLAQGKAYTVGCQGSGAEIEIRHSSVSRRHCSVQLDGPEPMVLITDLESTNGTVVNGQQLGGGNSKVSSKGLPRLKAFPARSEHLVRLGQCNHDFKVVTCV